MKQFNSSILVGVLISLIISCTGGRQQNRFIENAISAVDSSIFIDTNGEVKVYNDFIDQVYRVEYCHLGMDSPEEFIRYNDNRKIGASEIRSYRKVWEKYMRKYYEMLDTSKIIAFVSDSLYTLEIPSLKAFTQLDTVLNAKIKALLKDTIDLKSAYFTVDSLKSKKIYFEKPLFKPVDWDKMPQDTALKYSDQNDAYWHSHVGKQIGNKYYIGSISMSRVKFNQDSTLCILECGYLAQSKCGYGNYYLLEKKNNRWRILAKRQSWVS